jgi:hypothetical protein
VNRLRRLLPAVAINAQRTRVIINSVRPRRAPRVVPWLTVKRNDLRLGRTYGHWWIELDSGESYGWWPKHTPLRLRDFLAGTVGDLNGVTAGAGGTSTRDPYHGETADHIFQPVLVRKRSDWHLRRDIRQAAQRAAGGWRWSPLHPALNCRTFQLALMAHAGLVDHPTADGSQGRGCPALRPLRAARLLRPYRPQPPLERP